MAAFFQFNFNNRNTILIIYFIRLDTIICVFKSIIKPLKYLFRLWFSIHILPHNTSIILRTCDYNIPIIIKGTREYIISMPFQSLKFLPIQIPKFRRCILRRSQQFFTLGIKANLRNRVIMSGQQSRRGEFGNIINFVG